MGLCVLVAWFRAGGRAIKCTDRWNSIGGIQKDEMCGAGTVCGRELQTGLWWGDRKENTWET